MGFQDYQITRPTLLRILYPNLRLLHYFHSSICFLYSVQLVGVSFPFRFQSLNPTFLRHEMFPSPQKFVQLVPRARTEDICPRVCLRKKRTQPSYCERLKTSPSRNVPFLNSSLHMTSRCMSKQQGTLRLQVKLISGFVAQMYITTLTGRLEILSWRSL